MISDGKEKIIFANQLRVVAFLSVVVWHWCGVFWILRDQVAYYVGGIPVVGENAFWNWVSLPLPYFHYGPFGVAVFFLISGFVIPISLNNRSRRSFLVGRFLRIYPVYIVASILMICILYATRIYFNEPIPFNLSIRNIIFNLFLINNLFGIPSMDWVNWTLAIEIKFYLICILFYPLINRQDIKFIFIISLGIYLLVYGSLDYHLIPIPFTELEVSLDALKHDLQFIPYLFIGTLFYYRHIEKISSFNLLFSSLLILFCFSMIWKIGPIADQFISFTVNYWYAYVLFYCCYLIRDYFKPNRLIDFLATQTYPFYVLHSIIGYALLKVLYSLNIRFSIALMITFLQY